MGTERATILRAKALTKRFGGLLALSDYSLDLAQGEVLGLIGPNGAGKTTAFNLLTGVLRPSSGSIGLASREGTERDLTGADPEVFAIAGIARTFQNIRLFRDLSVWENVAVGLHMREGPGWLATILGLPGARQQELALRDRSVALLEQLEIAEVAERRAGDLAYGLQRKVEIARALATRPRVLLLDEPAAGMNATETATLTAMLQRLAAAPEGPTLVVVEHDMRLVMSLCRRVQVLNRGQLLADGTPEAVQQDPAVVAAYLGTGRSGGRARRREQDHAPA